MKTAHRHGIVVVRGMVGFTDMGSTETD